MVLVDWLWAAIALAFVVVAWFGAQCRPKGHRGSTYAAAGYGIVVCVHLAGCRYAVPAADWIALGLGVLCVAMMYYEFVNQRSRLLTYEISEVEKALKKLR